jgi:predicted extracellular nuclease
VLVNHFKSKGFGSPAESNRKRKSQAQRVADIYRDLRAKGRKLIAIVGDLNDTPDSDPLSPLIGGTDVKDISAHADFDDGGFKGTFGSSGPGNKIDYLLLSPELTAKVRRGGVFRKGVWPGIQPPKWPKYDEMEKEIHAVSDHAAIWADIDV